MAAVWLLLGSDGAGWLAAQAPQQRPAVPNATAADDDAYWAKATTAKAADHWAQSRAATGPPAAGQPPATGYPATPGTTPGTAPGTTAPWAGYPQTPGMYRQAGPQVPAGTPGPAGAYPPAQQAGAMGPAAPQMGPQAGPNAYAPPYPATGQSPQPFGVSPAGPAYPSMAANVGPPVGPPVYTDPPSFAPPPMQQVPGYPATAPGYPATAPVPQQAPPEDRASSAGTQQAWDNPYGGAEHPLLQSNPAADYRRRNVEPSAESASPRYGTASDGTAGPVNATPQTASAAPVQPAGMAPSGTSTPGMTVPPVRSPAKATAEVESPQDLLRNLLNINGDRCLATVGPEVILLSEILPEVDKILEPYKGQAPEEALEMQRIMLIQRLLAQHIDIKLLLVDLKNKVPKDNLPKLRDQFLEPFEEKEIPNLLEQYEVTNRSELDQAMRGEGLTLVQYRQQFIDRTMAGTWARQQIKGDKEITHQDMVDYYRAHLTDYEFPAKARWEQITVEFGGRRTKEEAFRQMAMLGNMVLDGVPFADVARQHSEGPTAGEGGQRDWTTKGSLVCVALDRALFELPVGQLSPIIEDRSSFHIIRVQERQAAGRVDFLEAQTDIRKKLQSEDRSEQVRVFIDKLRKEIDVWTIFDEFKEEVAQEPPKTIY